MVGTLIAVGVTLAVVLTGNDDNGNDDTSEHIITPPTLCQGTYSSVVH